MSFTCGEHPQHSGVGVCASCVRERLALCIRSLKGGGEDDQANGEEEAGEEEQASTRDGGYPAATSVSANDKGPLSSYTGSSLDCSRHIRAISNDENYTGKESPFYIPAKEGFIRGSQPSSTRSSSYVGEYNKEGAFSWLSAPLFFKRSSNPRKPQCAHHSLYHHYSSSSPSLISSWDDEPPRSSSWERISPWKRLSSRSPSKLAPVARSPSNRHTPSSQPTLSPLHLCVSSQPTRSPLQLPLTASGPLPASRSPFLLPSPRTQTCARPTVASPTSWRARMALSTEEAIDRNGQKISGGLGRKSKAIWVWHLLRRLGTNFKIKRRFHQRQQAAGVERGSSDGTASRATDSDFHRHSYMSSKQQAPRHFSDLQFSAFYNRPHGSASREGSTIMDLPRDLDSYCNKSLLHNISRDVHGLEGRHRYKSMSLVHQRESGELLRFYLTPSGFCSSVRS